MEFIDALQELVTAMPAFREESTVEAIRAAFEQERFDRVERAELVNRITELEDAITSETSHESGIPDGDQ